MTERKADMIQAIDHYLGVTLRSVMTGQLATPWPSDWPRNPDFVEAFCARIMFHGIALVLLREQGKLAEWPEQARAAIQKEARAQSFWEMGHRGVLTRFMDALEQAGSTCILSKGSALAYSVYPDPAMRRRGDSDVLLANASRPSVRRALGAAGFRRVGDARPLQESWVAVCGMGFTHMFDLHWRVNASALVAQGLERAGIGSRSAPLPRLSDNARAIAAADNLILVAINRAAHKTFGYRSGDSKLFERNRLIWALDFDLLTKTFGPDDWEDLLAATAASGTGPQVADALAFATSALGTAVPADVQQRLAEQPGDPQVREYLADMSGRERLWHDLSASPGFVAKLRLTGYTLFPGTEVLHERFPDATHWPIPALQGRRLAAGAAKLIGRRA